MWGQGFKKKGRGKLTYEMAQGSGLLYTQRVIVTPDAFKPSAQSFDMKTLYVITLPTHASAEVTPGGGGYMYTKTAPVLCYAEKTVSEEKWKWSIDTKNEVY